MTFLKVWLQVYLMTPQALARFTRGGESRRRSVLQMSIEAVQTEPQLSVFHQIERFDVRLLKRVIPQGAGSLKGYKGHGVDIPALADFYQAIAAGHGGLDNGHLPGREFVPGAKLRVGGAGTREAHSTGRSCTG